MLHNPYLIGSAALVAIGIFAWWRKHQDKKNANQRELGRMRRLRTVIFWATVAGLGVSVALNIHHAPNHEIVTLVMAGMAPVAVLIVLELSARIPLPQGKRMMRILSVASAAIVGLTALALSYERQRETALGQGFAHWEAYLIPIGIDGLMAFIAIRLSVLSDRIREVEIEEFGGAVHQRPKAPAAIGSVRNQERGSYLKPVEGRERRQRTSAGGKRRPELSPDLRPRGRGSRVTARPVEVDEIGPSPAVEADIPVSPGVGPVR